MACCMCTARSTKAINSRENEHKSMIILLPYYFTSCLGCAMSERQKTRDLADINLRMPCCCMPMLLPHACVATRICRHMPVLPYACAATCLCYRMRMSVQSHSVNSIAAARGLAVARGSGGTRQWRSHGHTHQIFG
eukprot:COSAG01_NODE_3164_length_6477_cov_6.494983_2_plen_136_part_00